MNQYDYNIHLQRTIGNQALQRLLHSNTRSDFAKSGIQAKLKVSQPGDMYRQRADRVAEQVMRISALDHVSSKLSNQEGRINRKCSACKMKKEKDEEEESLNITRKPSATTGFEANNEVTKEINNVLSSLGSPVDSDIKRIMESRFGHDFSRVRYSYR